MLYTETVAGPTLELLKNLEVEAAMAKKQDKVLESFPLSRKKQTPEPVKKRGLKRKIYGGKMGPIIIICLIQNMP